MINNATGLIFDLDGVLLDSETNLKWLYKAIKQTLVYFGLEVSKENLEKLHFKNIYRFNEICNDFGISLEKIWSVRNNYYIEEKIKAIINRAITPFSDVKSLYELKGKFDIYILSNSPQVIVDLFIDEFKYRDLFNCGIGRGNSYSDFLKMKPNTYLFEKLKNKIDNQKFIYIGDSEIDRKFAENIGSEFILLSRVENKLFFTSLKEIVKFLVNNDYKDK